MKTTIKDLRKIIKEVLEEIGGGSSDPVAGKLDQLLTQIHDLATDMRGSKDPKQMRTLADIESQVQMLVKARRSSSRPPA